MNRFDKLITRKKIILVAFCLILFLIFTATSYGEIDPKYDKLRGHPWGHMLSPKPDNDQNLDFVVLAINSHFYVIFKSQSKIENFNEVGKSTDQKSASSTKQRSLNTHETKSKR